MLTTALAIFTLAAAAIASPAQRRQSSAPGCAGAFNGVGNVASFTLEAFFDGNKTTVPLGLVPMTPSLLNSFIAVCIF
jgi:hypothetical protein